jgi:putative restriction endonuclease
VKIALMQSSAGWSQPIFKILANNDTGAAPGHQGGILIPKALRKYFPELSGAVSGVKPTIDKRLKAELFVEGKFLGTVNTRYQFQTWTDTRSPESRITDRLGPMRDLAAGGDVLVINRSTLSATEYRLTLVRKSSAEFPTIKQLIGARRWGVLG